MGRTAAAPGLTGAAGPPSLLAGGDPLLHSGSGYEVRFRISNASQLVKGNQVKVGGIPVGDIRDIALAPDGEAEMTIRIDDDGLTPLHEGSRIEVRSTSLSGIANRYLSLTPGP